MVHRPLINGVPTQSSTSDPQIPMLQHPHETFDSHLQPFGMNMPIIDSTKILRICVRNPQHSFQIYGDSLELSYTISNLLHAGVQMLTSISQNVNWENDRKKLHHTHQIFRQFSNYVHLSVTSSDIGVELENIHKNLIAGTAILTFGLCSSKVSHSSFDPDGYGS